jgi:hypothetical protein
MKSIKSLPSIRFLLLLMLTACSLVATAQNGYVKLGNDSLIVGYVRLVFLNGQLAMEVWRTKYDKSPRRIPKSAIAEYAIKKDTFQVLHNFTVFPELKHPVSFENYYDVLNAKTLSRGKVNLLGIVLQKRNTNYHAGIAGAAVNIYVGSYSLPTYLLEDPSTGYVKALSRNNEKFHQTLLEFFPEKYITRYEEVNGPLKYKMIPAVVKLYNKKAK